MTCQRIFSAAVLSLLLLSNAVPSFAVSLQGIVTDRTRKPLPNATVQLIVDKPAYFLPEDLTPLAQAKTDHSGSFSLDAPNTTQSVALIAWADSQRITKFPVQPESAAKRTVGLALDKGEIIDGQVVDTDDKPIAGALIGPLVAAPDVDWATAKRVIPQWTRTDADGSFKFDHVMSETEHHFVTWAEGYEIVDTRAIAGRSGILVKLRKGGSTVPGKLFSKNGPDSQFAGTHVRMNGNGFDLTTVANARGEFAYRGVPAGTYSVEAIQSNRPTRIRTVILPVDEGTTVQLEVSTGYFISGSALDDETSQPASGVTLMVNDTLTTADANGHFKTERLWATGQPAISIPSNSGFRLSEEAALKLTSLPMLTGLDDLGDVQVRVQKERTLRVQLANVSLTTQPITVHLLQPKTPEKRVLTTTSTAQLGVYESGDYYLYAESGDYASRLISLNVQHEDQIPVPLALEPAARLRGSVEMPSTSGTRHLDRFVVKLNAGDSPSSGIVLSQTGCAPDGTFSFPLLPTGSLIAEVANASATRHEQKQIELKAGWNDPLVFALQAGRNLGGTVRGADGKPIPSVSVRFQYKSEGGVPKAGLVETDNSGHFLAEDLETQLVDTLHIEQFGFASFRQNEIALPNEELAIMLMPAGALRVMIEAPPQTKWELTLMQSAPWQVGAYADQLMSRPVSQKTAQGGETAQMEVTTDGRYRVVAKSDSGALAVSEPFIWVSDDPQGQTITLTPNVVGQISGTLGGANNASVEIIATNTALPDSFAQSETRVQTSNGQFRFDQMPAGDYLVQAVGESYSAAATNIELKPGGSEQVQLKAASLASVTGKVTIDNAPQAGVQVTLISQTDENSQQREAKTGSDGSFSFENVTADNYMVRASLTPSDGSGEIKGQRPVVVPRDGTPAPVSINLTRPRTVSLRLPDEFQIAPNSAISFANKETGQVIKLTWRGDNLEGDLAPGTYDIWKEADVIGRATVDANGTANFTR